jgi:hydroxypyruvate reductase
VIDLRAVARRCCDAAVRAVDPRPLAHQALKALDLEAPVTLVAVGKAASRMAEGSVERLGRQIREGLVVIPRDGLIGDLPVDFSVERAGHPVPDRASVLAAERVRELAKGMDEQGTFLLLLSGGGSALMTLPAGELSLDDLERTIRLLLDSGAPIDELNAVRKHLDALKGGRLAKLVRGRRIVALVLSDVVGDRLDVIASGPVVPDATAFADAVRVLRSRELWARVPDPVRRHLRLGLEGGAEESPAELDACFRRVDCQIIGSNHQALQAALSEAARAGFEPRRLDAPLEGEARTAGSALAALARDLRASRPVGENPVCVVAGGETTVTVSGSGSGGRSQELVLAAALGIEACEGVLVAGFGTDGRDGPTDAAGAWADRASLARARLLGLDARAALEDNDSYPFFAALDDHIMTGPTGTNVMDLALVFIA